jgi:transposase InsO family protein
VKFALIDAEKAWFPIEFMCEELGVSRSGFYAWRQREPSRRDREDVLLGVEVAAAHEASSKRYGSTRVHKALLAAGRRTSRKRVARLMRKQQLIARPQRRKKRAIRTTDSNHAFPIAPDLVGREFTAAAPNKVCEPPPISWTPQKARECARSCPCHELSMSRRKRRAFTAEFKREAVGLTKVGDRSIPELVASMSRTGDCWDNAVAESFFASLKAELVDHERYPSHSAAISSIGDYIDNFYNPLRRHSSLGYLNPIEYELRTRVAALAA